MEEKLAAIKTWLGTGSINIFGLPMSGKDTVGVHLAEDLGAKFLSSGMIIRAAEQERNEYITDKGQLAPTNVFFDLVLPYFDREDLREFPLVLSSVGRWAGEESQVLAVAEAAGHPVKAAIILNVSEADVMDRWEVAHMLGDRGARPDDMKPEVFKTRIAEFDEKTRPVLRHYRELGLLVEVRADMVRELVYEEAVNKLYEFAVKGERLYE